MDTPASAQSPLAATEDKTVAIVAYITLVGFIVAIILHSSKKTALGAFHLRQVLGLILTGIVGGIAVMIVAVVFAFIPFVGFIVSLLLYFCFGIGMLVLFIVGLLSAIKGEMKPMPVVGEYYEKWFAGVFN